MVGVDSRYNSCHFTHSNVASYNIEILRCYQQIKHAHRIDHMETVLDLAAIYCLGLFVYRKFSRVFCGFSKISYFLERIIIEHIEMKNNLDSKRQIYFICSIRTWSRKWDIVENPQQLKFNPSLWYQKLTSDITLLIHKFFVQSSQSFNE